jgi:hypothetical protein
MKVRLLLTLAGLISFAVPASIAQDAMKVVSADEVVWKDDTLFKGAQIANLLGDPAKAETVVMRVKWPPNFKVPLHTHPVTEVLTVNLPRFDGHGNSKKERGPDGSKKERAPGVYGGIQKPSSGDGDPQRQERCADSARAWVQRSESAWMEEEVFEAARAGAN